jgi:hypothetical protein
MRGGIKGQVPDCMLADAVDKRHTRPPGVVQIGEAVGKARLQVQQRRGWSPGHASSAVRDTGAVSPVSVKQWKNPTDLMTIVTSRLAYIFLL